MVRTQPTLPSWLCFCVHMVDICIPSPSTSSLCPLSGALAKTLLPTQYAFTPAPPQTPKVYKKAGDFCSRLLVRKMTPALSPQPSPPTYIVFGLTLTQ